MIRLIVSDIDGTLVQDGGNQLNPEYFDVILELKKKGIHFVAASGRQVASIETLFAPIREKIFYLGDNGAYVGCYGRNLFLYPMDREIALQLIGDIRSNPSLEVMVDGPRTAYMETKNQEFITWMREEYKFELEVVEDVTKVEDEFIKISAYKKEDIQSQVQFFYDKYRDKLKITIAGDMWMDCMKTDVNKGNAVRLLQESLDIKPEETMIFGDQLNDIEMLNQAYYSFAVGNARDEVKKAARFQTDINKNDGVLKVLKTLL